MKTDELMVLGLGLKSPWKLKSQRLDTDKQPYDLHLEVGVGRGSQHACPECGALCPGHDSKQKRWRHLNFFQHHCYINAAVPRVKCPKHGVRQIEVPWARKGSGFTLLFEQAALTLVREMPVQAVARIIGVTDKRLWRVVEHYVQQAMAKLDLSGLKAIGLDETASKHGQNYVTTFIDMDRRKLPVLYATPGRGKQTLKDFKAFLTNHHGDPEQVTEAVCDMSSAFQQGLKEHFPKASITVDWFHIVQSFTRAVGKVRKTEAKDKSLPTASHWAVLKGYRTKALTEKQNQALKELIRMGTHTSIAWMIKEKLRWIRQATSLRGACWRLTRFLNLVSAIVETEPMLSPMRKAVDTLRRHSGQVIRRWISQYTNARMEGLNSLFQAARSRARGYRNDKTFITMIYMIASPVAHILKST